MGTRIEKLEKRFLGSEKREKKKKAERQGDIEKIVERKKRKGGKEGNWEDLEVRLRSLKLEREKKRREEKKRNI